MTLLRFFTARFLFMCGFFAYISLSSGVAVQAASATARHQPQIAKVERYLNGLTTLVADFMQEAPDGSVSSGVFFLSRPGRLRWQYDPPVPLLIVANDSLLTYYDMELDEISYVSMKDSLAGFLARKDIRFDRDIEVLNASDEAGLFRITIGLRGKPEEGKITLVFDNIGFALKKLIAEDATRQRTSVTLSNLRYGELLDKQLFIVKNPRIFNPKKRN